ncbi:MAG TPA: FliM/FliN family flagellar motor switch protein [Terracidiphilus sp.]|jgi:flagellar motor switch protein FliN/FliY|nr:FliM/FliN family flagellar motor switch protein [Terracidiphilus sp.]
MNYLDCWIATAGTLFSQALAGEPEMAEAPARPMQGQAPVFTAVLGGDVEGSFTVVLDPLLMTSPLLGEGADQKASWNELLKEAAEAAAGDLLARTGIKCRVERFEEAGEASPVTRAFQLKTGAQSWQVLVRDGVRDMARVEGAAKSGESQLNAPPTSGKAAEAGPTRPGLELLLDVELEATIRFGCRELPLSQILELGPGDVVTLDRHISDPADLIVGDKIVARGEVVVVNGNFGLRVTEVAAPRKRLESIRCLF